MKSKVDEETLDCHVVMQKISNDLQLLDQKLYHAVKALEFIKGVDFSSFVSSEREEIYNILMLPNIIVDRTIQQIINKDIIASFSGTFLKFSKANSLITLFSVEKKVVNEKVKYEISYVN